MEDIGALFPSGDPALAGADSLELLREAWRTRTRGRLGARERRRRADRRRAARRSASRRDARASRRRARCRSRARGRARDDDRRARLHRAGEKGWPHRRSPCCGGERSASSRTRSSDLRGTDARLLAGVHERTTRSSRRSGRGSTTSTRTSSSGSSTARRRSRTRARSRCNGTACPSSAAWAPAISERGRRRADDALRRRGGLLPEYRGRGLLGDAAAHDESRNCARPRRMIAPVRPTWKDRYPLTPSSTTSCGGGRTASPTTRGSGRDERVGAEVVDPRRRAR